MGETCIKSIRLFWNQVDSNERSPLNDIYNKLIDELGLKFMERPIMNSMRFLKVGEAYARTAFRFKILPPDERLMKACRLDLFMK